MAQPYGIVHRLATRGLPERIASLAAVMHTRARSLRLVLPPLTRPEVEHAVACVESVPARWDLLVVLQPDCTALAAFSSNVARLTQAMRPGRHGVELALCPRVPSVWGVELGHEPLAAAYTEAAREVRARGLALAWGVEAPLAEATLQALARTRCIGETDPIVLDLTSCASSSDWPTAVGRARTEWSGERVWLTAGLGRDPNRRSDDEMGVYLSAARLEAPRLYWEPSADLFRLWMRRDPSATLRLLAPRGAETGAVVAPESRASDRVLVTGGSGFIGCNLAARLLDEGVEVVVLDNFDREGVERNIEWLRAGWGAGLRVVPGDVRDPATVRAALEGVGCVFHLAGQVAVTSSLDDPITDFEVNARGTLNVLEEVRRRSLPPSVVFTSTNKVYGNLEHLALRELDDRYVPVDDRVRACGIDETCGLDLHSPYGCSKGAGDQYMLDYAKSYGIRAVVFRMSCIYGPRQLGTEDQGWVAHFIRSALEQGELTVYGDGKQVRDILFVDDLVDAFLLAMDQVERIQGRAYNIGGGPNSAISLRELLHWIATAHDQRPLTKFSSWRRGDQRYYVSDTSRFRDATGWAPKITNHAGLRQLRAWLVELSRRNQAADGDRSSFSGALAR